MSWKLDITEEANEDILLAYDYYEDQQPGLGDRFFTQVKKRLTYIKKHPFHFARNENQYRQSLVARFPYLIIYDIEEDTVIILSCFHTSMDPDKKP